MCVLRSVFFVPAIALSLVAGPASAANFQVLGGMGNGDAVPYSKQRQNFGGIPASLKKELVDFNQGLSAGSLFIKTSERALYYVMPGGKAWRYPVGVGRQGFEWSGENVITRKAEWPEWRPPSAMIDREAKRGRHLPAVMRGGQGNPLGARALYIGDTEYRIHGTSQPWSIGRASSSGCIRMLNAHVIELYSLVEMGAKVVVAQ
jgi:lipoprotein-anchoring transpeptidase ErfK/SrfK